MKRSILIYREENIEISNAEIELVRQVYRNIRKNRRAGLIIDFSEDNNLLLRLIVSELMYKYYELKTPFAFITDSTGKRFVNESLKELRTKRDSSSLYRLLIQNPIKQNKVFDINRDTKNLKIFNYFIFFRVPNIFESLNEFYGHKVLILTKRDKNKVGDRIKSIVSDLKHSGWAYLEVSVKNKNKRQIEKDDVKISLIDDHDLSSLLKEILDALSNSNGSTNDIEALINFYFTLPIKLKSYNELQYEHTHNSNLEQLPSEQIAKNNKLCPRDSLMFNLLFQKMENHLLDTNLKFNHVLLRAKALNELGKTVSLLLPNRNYSEMFSEVIADTDYKNIIEADNIWYPELISRDVLMDEIIIDTIMIPFVPSNTVLDDVLTIAEDVIFVLYPEEVLILEHFTNMSQDDNIMHDSTEFNSNLKINQRGCSSTKTSKFTDLKKYMNNNFRDFKRGFHYTSYSGFLRSLDADDDIEEVSDLDDMNRSINYKIICAEGNIIESSSLEHVILFEKGFYSPIYASKLKKNQEFIVISSETKLKYLEREIESHRNNRLLSNMEYESLIGYIAEWKSALKSVLKEYELKEIYSKLNHDGYRYNYVTIKNWFKGLENDPKKSAINSILNTNTNIGPRDEETIKIFGEIFDLPQLIQNYRFISASMKHFRTNNRIAGRRAMKNIVMDLKQGNLELPKHKVKKITSKEQ